VLGRKRKQEDGPGETEATTAASALQDENARLRRTVEQLALLNDLAQAMGLSDSSDEMIQAVVSRAKRTLAAEQVMIYFIERKGGKDLLQTKVRDVTVHERRAFHFDDALRAMMETHKAPFRSNDPHHEPRLRWVTLDPQLRSLLCVPLLVRGKVTGLVAACNKLGAAGFDEEDQRLLSIIANHSAQILETTRLREEEAAYEQLHREVQMARDIQNALLPEAPPQVDGYDIAGGSVSAELVGGDYFDFIDLADGRVGVCLGDVSGKGVPASLLMANLQATMRGQARINDSAGDCVRWANRLLYRSTAPDKFATLFYGILDPHSNVFRYCNAGHERPLLLSCSPSGDCVQEVAGGGLILGVVDDFPYTETALDLVPGATLLIYSDGLTDAVNAADRPFGVAGVEQVLKGLDHPSAQQILDSLLAAVKVHTGEVPAFDDVTLVIVRRLAIADG